MRNYPFLRLIITFIILLPSFSYSPVQAGLQGQTQMEEGQTRALNLMAEMTPEERVGQLFLVTFQGTSVNQDTQIYDLINNHHVGGVVLLAENNNFTASTFNLNNLWTLINQLQTSRYATSQDTSTGSTDTPMEPPAYIPLFIGVSQEGGGYPNDQILNGLTPLPSQLSIGATWNTELARQVGAVSGKELSDIGINLIFGPPLDVVENPLLQGASELKTRSFGGDPYWVGEMGRAYIRGLHEGSNNRMVVVATHFPGLGSADHVPKEEVATVRKSLEQLKQIELAPFFAVTGNVFTPTERVDALLTSHIRYQGLQGNIRSTTRPLGFDQQALSLLMDLPAFSTWRSAGGVMISEDLGSRAVRRFYDPTEQEFNARRLALDAFLAGNDLLFLNNFIEPEDPDSYTTILRTIDYFIQKYREDPLFAERVDQSVLRILSLKTQIYGEFNLNLVLTSGNLNHIGNFTQVTYDVARQGVTLISPSAADLDTVLPNIPGRQDRIVFFTDSYTVKQCDTCYEQYVVPTDALSKAILNLYGPQAGGLVSQFYLRPFSYAQLMDLLNGEGDTEQLEIDLSLTNWIIFTMLDESDERPSSMALDRFLTERPDLISNRRVIVFATGGPNYLESTDISKLTAYFGLFSKSTPFIDIAARILFKEIAQPPGSLPVSVAGVGYDLILATSPDSEQNISILLDIPAWNEIEDSAPPEGLTIPDYRIGDTIPLKTGVIFDTNGHPVPNNTPVQFLVTINGEQAPPISAVTTNGIANAVYIVERSGALAIQAVSDMASSLNLIFEIPIEESTTEPSPTVTSTVSPTPDPSPTTLPPTPSPTPEVQTDASTHRLTDWLGGLVVAFFMGWGATRTGSLLGKVRWGIRWGFAAFIGGMLFYTYTVLKLPGSEIMLTASTSWGLILATFLGTVVGWLIALSIHMKYPPGSKPK